MPMDNGKTFLLFYFQHIPSVQFKYERKISKKKKLLISKFQNHHR